MFLPFIAVAAIATMLIQLGALSVWVAVLKAMLVVALAVALVFGLLFVWRSYRVPTESKTKVPYM